MLLHKVWDCLLSFERCACHSQAGQLCAHVHIQRCSITVRAQKVRAAPTCLQQTGSKSDFLSPGPAPFLPPLPLLHVKKHTQVERCGSHLLLAEHVVLGLRQDPVEVLCGQALELNPNGEASLQLRQHVGGLGGEESPCMHQTALPTTLRHTDTNNCHGTGQGNRWCSSRCLRLSVRAHANHANPRKAV